MEKSVDIGEKNSLKRNILWTIGIIFLLLIALIISSGCLSSVKSKYSDLTLQQLKQQAVAPSYSDLYRNADKWNGELVEVTGQVFQVGNGFLLIWTKKDPILDTYLDNPIYIEYSGSKVMKNDYVTIYGESLGLFTYDTTGGSTNTVPAIRSCYTLYWADE